MMLFALTTQTKRLSFLENKRDRFVSFNSKEKLNKNEDYQKTSTCYSTFIFIASGFVNYSD